ncbi:protein FAM151A [Bombina bombina]|uniref:protein FAM151A n=1 Tax=Bombina bombina TaxID=8345 RepID=UPI00235A5C3E|nr:protein FAM151A [Bombina bombina]
MKRCSVSDFRTLAGVGVFLAVCVTIAVLCLTLGRTPNQGSVSFHTGSDMLDYLMSQKRIDAKDGLLVSWYHGANSISQMNEALNSGIMILEADVNVEGHRTPNQTDLPIMAHPPDVYSDNTLQNWINTVVDSTKGIKLDFKSIEAVGPSLDILRAKCSKAPINRPVWVNADILNGPNVFLNAAVNASRFLQLVQEKFPDVTISPGWVTLYLPPVISNKTYTWEMIQQMYSLIKDLPQRITFPARVPLTWSAWPYFYWLMQRSDRYSLTLWQGKSDPVTLKDLLCIRDSSSPEKIYYDIYEPLLSEFKEAVLGENRKRCFYSGGSLLKYFHPEDEDGLLVKWYEAKGNLSSVLRLLRESSGMVTLHIELQKISSISVPVLSLANSPTVLTLEDCLEEIISGPNTWGILLKINDQVTLNWTLTILRKLHDQSPLLFPIWISMDVSHGSFSTPGYIEGKEFIRTINDIFPYVTVAPGWPVEALSLGYTELLVQDMLSLCGGIWQDVSFQLSAVALGTSWLNSVTLLEASPSFSITVEHSPEQGTFMDGYKGLMAIRSHTENRVYYKLPQDYSELLLENIFTS